MTAGPDGVARRVAVVTGAVGGLGQAVVRRLAADGFTVAALDIYLASPDGAMVTGQLLVCDGGGLLH